MTRGLRCLLSLLVVAVVIVACAQPAPTPTAVPTPVPPTPKPVPPTATPKPTEPPKPQQAALGEETFGLYCGSCHAGGFTTLAVSGYRTAEKLYDYIRGRMPPGNPNAVSDTRRYAVVSYLLVKAGLIQPDVTISAETAASISFGDAPAPAGESQTVSGQKAFDAYCSGCHGAGFATKAVQRYRTALGLFQFLRSSMPPGNPDRVPEKSAYDIVAYILSKAGLLKEGQAVNADSAQSISFE